MRSFTKGHIRGVISKDGKTYYSINFMGAPDNWQIQWTSDQGRHEKAFSSRKDAQMFLEATR